jgi:hypothetical protein
MTRAKPGLTVEAVPNQTDSTRHRAELAAASLGDAGVRGVALTIVDTAVCVPETPHTSRDLLVLVDQPVEPVTPSDCARVVFRPLGEWP